MRNELPLELWLQYHAEASATQFPERDQHYWKRYEYIKDYLNKNYFRNIGAGLASEGILYTQHDLEHVNDVINMAGRLLGADQHAAGSKGDAPIHRLRPYEIYALLVAILLHDAGNASGRKGHEKKAFAILGELPQVCVDTTERRTIAKIAQAHGGRGPGGEKDTINSVIQEDPADVQSVTIRLRMLAAVLRMADEISEGPRRANDQALKKPYPSKAAAIHNLYCKVVGIAFDLHARQITLSYEIDVGHLEEEFEDNGEDIRIVDYLANRLGKCDAERQYCNRYYASLFLIEKIVVRLIISRNNGEDILYRRSFEFIDEGYPSSDRVVKKQWPTNEAVLADCRDRQAADGGAQ